MFSYFCSETNRLGEAVLTSTHNLCFEQKFENNITIFIGKISAFGGEIFYIFELACFRKDIHTSAV